MEQFRLFMAITLSVLVFVVWSIFFVEKPETPVEQQVVENKVEKNEVNKDTQVAVKDVDKKELAVKKAEPVDNRVEKFYTVDTPLYKVSISDKGANFKSFKLKKYNETNKAEKLKELVEHNETLNMAFKHKSVEGLEKAYFSTTASNELNVNEKKDITFSYTSKNGIIVEKTYTFDPKSYVIDCSVNVKNLSNSAINDSLSITLVNGNPDSRMSFVGASVYKDGKVEEFKLDDLDDKNSASGNINWVSFQDRYFLSSILIDKKDQETSFKVSLNNNVSYTTVENKLEVIQPEKQLTHNFRVYMGPIQNDALNQAGSDLSKTLDFGWFTFIGKPCLIAMNWIHQYIPNYGLTIIFLTLFIKLILWPLGNKGYKSMNDMKKLQPIMTEIREKYKDDKKKMNEEVMNLYKTYKINPLGGCLPILAQIPIFFAFYRMLYQAIELRHAPFFGWITDLSAPDRLFDFGFAIPFMEPPYGIPVLTILMGASMFIQQKMTPQAGDATQQKIMMLMPLFMTVIFVNFSSGLVLYWFVNNIFSIAQQYYTMKKKVK